jgi:hypothetical protein
MNIDFAAKLLKRVGKIDPPGCCNTYLEHPALPLRKRRCVELGFVMEHRFAFYYWLKCKRSMMNDPRTKLRSTDRDFSPPDLITWDWHDDVGGECDFSKDELLALNQSDEEEVSLFCWAGLRQINDGHIAPAVWLNALGNVYVLQKQRDKDECEHDTRVCTDRYGRKHQISYFRKPSDLAREYAETNSGTGVIWDVDLDFFTNEEDVSDQRYRPLVSSRVVRRILRQDNLWMQQILGDLRAITIALEPSYTGGLTQSLYLYGLWEKALFTKSVFEDSCHWREEMGG